MNAANISNTTPPSDDSEHRSPPSALKMGLSHSFMGTFILSVTLRSPPTDFLLFIWKNASAWWTRELMSGHPSQSACAHSGTLTLCHHALPLISQQWWFWNTDVNSGWDSVLIKQLILERSLIEKYWEITSVIRHFYVLNEVLLCKCNAGFSLQWLCWTIQ